VGAAQHGRTPGMAGRSDASTLSCAWLASTGMCDCFVDDASSVVREMATLEASPTNHQNTRMCRRNGRKIVASTPTPAKSRPRTIHFQISALAEPLACRLIVGRGVPGFGGMAGTVIMAVVERTVESAEVAGASITAAVGIRADGLAALGSEPF